MESLIKENEGMIYKIISKYRNYFELEDLYQVAVIGLIKAYNNFNTSFNTKFSTYAYPYIVGEVIKYINDSKGIKLGREYQLLYKRIISAHNILTQRLMKEPSIKELSLFLEIDESIINETLSMNRSVDSLDKLLKEESDNFDLYSKYGYNDNSIENYSLIHEINRLSPQEKYIIISRFYKDLSQSEIGKELGIHQVEVSRQEKKILKRLRDGISA